MRRAEGAVPPLHVVTDDAVCAGPGFAAAAAAVLRAGGADLALHVRLPGAGGRRVYDLAVSLQPCAARSGALLVVNDRVDVALAVGAGAVQLGGRSLDVGDVRGLGGDRLRIGVSVHEADARAPGADWVVAGHVFPTASHPGRPAAGLELIAGLAAAGTPVVAIGGITPARVPEVRRAGAAGVAVMRGVWHAARPARAVEEYLNLWYLR